MGIQPDHQLRLEAALAAAVGAGELIQRHAHARSFETQTKRDGTPVTSADREAEEYLRRELLRAFPEDGFLGEEFGETAGSGGYRWVADPIDGTRSFLHGVPLYGTLLSVEHLGQPLLGVIHMPGLGESVYGGKDLGCWHIPGPSLPKRRAQVSNIDDLAESAVCVTCPQTFERNECGQLLSKLATTCKTVRGWSDCYGHLLVATGRAEGVVEPALARWDISASIAVVREAGGEVTTFSGDDASPGSNAIVSNGRVHDALRSLCRG